MAHASSSPVDLAVARFASYDDYLDSFVTAKDLAYVTDITTARQLLELGYRGAGILVTREGFAARQSTREDNKHGHSTLVRHKLASGGRSYAGNPLLQALAEREAAVLSGQLATIIFVRAVNDAGHEVSGYIDYAQRLRQGKMVKVFDGEQRLLPHTSDLSYYNWQCGTTKSTHSATFLVVADASVGLLFQHKVDRKCVNVDPNSSPGDSTTQVLVEDTQGYLQLVLYDHVPRKHAS